MMTRSFGVWSTLWLSSWAAALCCLPRLISAADEPNDLRREYVTRLWRMEDGLPDRSVKALLQTRDGYLWIGTPRGLSRFDGKTFKTWNRVNTPEMLSDEILRLQEDLEGNVWIGTTHGLLRKSKDGFHRCVETSRTTLAESVLALAARKRGGIWVGTARGLMIATDSGMRRLNGLDAAVVQTAALFEDQAGVLWAGTSHGLLQVDPENGSFRPAATAESNPPYAVTAIHSAPNGGLWVLFQENEHQRWLYRLDKLGWEKIGGAFGSSIFTSLLWANEAGDIWICRHPQAVARLRAGSMGSLLLDAQAPNPQCALEDREGNLWIGTETVGLYCAHPSRVLTFTAQDGLAHDQVWSIFQDHQGTLWFGTEGGLSQFQHGSFTSFTTAQGLPRNVVRSLAEDDDGRLWVGTLSGIVCVQDGSVRSNEFKETWRRSKTHALLVDRSNRLWIGADDGLRRITFPSRTGQDETVPVATFRTHDGLPADNVSSLLEDKSGTIWIGTAGGLARWHSDQINAVTNVSELKGVNIGVLLQDNDNAGVWIGADRRLIRFYNGRFHPLAPSDGLPDDVVNCLLDDGCGGFWLGGDRGIYRTDKAQLQAVAEGLQSKTAFVRYAEEDGLQSPETNGQRSQPSAWRSADGHLWFATSKGVAAFDPRRIPGVSPLPPVLIEEIRANGKAVNPLDQVLPEPGKESRRTADVPELRFAPGSARILEIEYTEPTFVAADEVGFHYRLEGVDTDWVEAGARRTAYYANLAPGHYRFIVAAENKYGDRSETPATLSFSIVPLYYQTMSFRFGAGVAILVLGWGVYRWRLAYQREIQRLQHATALLHERERLARDLHDGLGADLTQITLLADLVATEPADAGRLHERLQGLSRSTRDALHAVKDVIWSAQPSGDSLESLIARICSHADQLAAAANMQCRIHLPETMPDLPLAREQRLGLYLVAKEALNNAAKHSGASQLTIRSRVEQSRFILEINDNGRGFDSSPAPGPGRPDLDSSGPGPRTRPAAGQGLRNMRERMEAMGGTLDIASHPGAGTQVRLELKLLT